MTQVTNFGTDPGQLDMFVYKPAGLTSNRPVVVFLHGCGSQAAQYDNETGWTKWADQMKFVLIFPQVTSVQPDGCFRYYMAEHQMYNAGEPLSVVQMVNWVQSHYNTDSKRVFVTGFSAGAAMTNIMLATYPDVFSAGAPVAGIPYKCTESPAGLDNCLKGNVTLTAKQWGDKVRAARPGYSGPWPRVSIWQGVDDGTVAPVNATWTMEQWTNVNGLTQTPQTSNTVSGQPHRVYGANVVEAYDVIGTGHQFPIKPGTGAEDCGSGYPGQDNGICASLYTARWFGLDK